MTTARPIIDISFHGIQKLTATARAVGGSKWVTLYVPGEEHELCTFFFQDVATATRFATAVNSAFAPLHFHDEEPTHDAP